MVRKVEERKKKWKEEILISSKLDTLSIRCDVANELENRLDIMEKFYKRLDDIDKSTDRFYIKSESNDYVRFLRK